MQLHSSVTQQVSINNFYTLEERFNKIHNNKYTYDKSIFINTKTKLIITCPIHGDFEQTPGNHLSGKGCLKCSGKNKYTTEDFIAKAININGNLYNYDNTHYVNAKTKVNINCPIHGEFFILPGNHYKGQGCPKCGIEHQAKSQRDTTDSFIIKAKSIHGTKYDYNLVNYKRSSENVIIICKDHGPFLQTPNSHLMGSGCSICTKTGFNPGKPAYLYSFNIHGIYKIGVTNRTVKERYNPKDFKNITELQEILFEDGSIAYKLEQKLKKKYKNMRYFGPTPFTDKTGVTECFTEKIDIQSFSDNYSDIPASIAKYPSIKQLSVTFLAPESNPMNIPGCTDISMS